MKKRVVFYIDGFNLYFGMKESGWRRYYWLNVWLLAEKLTLDTQQLLGVKYFTSRIRQPQDKRLRQNTYLDALQATSGIEIFYGQFYDQYFTCPACKRREPVPAEKMTDVNITTQLLADAFLDTYDTAFVISADSDLVPPMSLIRERFPAKRVVAAFPPNRTSNEIKKTAHAAFNVNKQHLSASQFPDVVIREDGFKLNRPTRWK